MLHMYYWWWVTEHHVQTGRPFIKGDVTVDSNLLLSTKILSMALLDLFCILIAESTVSNRLWVVNKEDNFFFRCSQGDNLCLCVHIIEIQFLVYANISRYHLVSDVTTSYLSIYRATIQKSCDATWKFQEYGCDVINMAALCYTYRKCNHSNTIILIWRHCVDI
jgi:hypothetical protein